MSEPASTTEPPAARPAPSRPAPRRWSELAPAVQLTLYLAIVLPVLWLAIAFAIGRSEQRTLADGNRESSNLVRVFSEEINSAVQAIDLTLLDLRERWQEEPANFAARVRSRQAHLARNVGFQVGIIGADGRLAYSSAGPAKHAIDLSDREHFRASRDSETDALFISSPVMGRISRRWTIQFTRPLHDAAGRFAGVIVLSVAPEHFMRFSRQIDIGQGGMLAVVRTSGQVLARAPAATTPLDHLRYALPPLDTTGANTLTESHKSRTDGTVRLYGWRHLPGRPLIVLVGRELDAVLAPWYRLRAALLWTGAGGSVLLALIGWFHFTGVQQRRRARQALEQSERRWKHALEGAREVVWDWDVDSGDVYFSPRFRQMMGYDAQDMPHRIEAWEALLHPEDRARALTALREHLAGRAETYICEYRVRGRDMAYKWVFARGTTVDRDAKGRALRMTGVLADITERKRAEEAEEAYQQRYDALTGLANRSQLRTEGARAIAQAAAGGGHVWAVSLDLDRFQVVNDALGHEAGDVLLQLVARRLQGALPGTDVVARVAGGEFAVFLAGGIDEHMAAGAVQRMREAVAAPVAIEGGEYNLSCSAGIAVYPGDGQTPDELVRHAEVAMRRAKALGRNTFQFYTAARNERAIDRLRIESDLRLALPRRELMLHYQPQVELRTGRITGAEALLRWHHPQLGLVPPDRFIRIAEESGQIAAIGAWVLREACAQARRWTNAGHPPLRISVNLSCQQFYRPDLVDTVAAALRDAGLPGSRLDLELTEGLVMEDVDAALATMHRLKALGVSLSLDDFGTGHSSLAYLQRLPIDVLKIDRSFVRGIADDPKAAAIATSIVALARSLQLAVIAEGVETEPQLACLRRHRCDQIQGYYFSRPVPAQDFEKLLADDRRLPAPAAPSGQTLLIVDDDAVAAALTRLLRPDGYRVLHARTANAALGLLALHDVQVMLSEQRLAGQGSGGDSGGFLARVKALYPQTIRIMLSGYTAVEALIDAMNSGAVFRFHAKPWDDEALRASIADAFRYHWLMYRAESVPGEAD